MPAETPARGDVRRHAPLLAAMAAAAWMMRGWRERWIPHDEGTLAGAAQRILDGQLPHRDFAETYTGGLAALHAALLAWEPRLSTLRLPLLAAALLILAPCLYALARRFAAPWPAAAIATAAFAWGVPNYPAALPSWFHLILAVAAFTALLRASDAGRGSRWRLLAGACAGLSICIKVSGFYTAGAALLFAALEEQRQSQGSGTGTEKTAALLPLHAVAAVLLAWVLVRILGPLASPETLFHFLLPPLAGALLLVAGEFRATGSTRFRLRALAAHALPVAIGACLACLPLVLVYARANALEDLFRGLFVLPARRLVYASLAPPPLHLAVWALPWALLIGLAPRAGRHVALASFVAACAILPWASELPIYRAIWSTARALPALLVVAGAWRAVREPGTGSALVVAAGFGGLIQFPYASPLYFTYAAPLVVLLAAWLARPLGRPAGALGLTFAIAFPVVWLHTSTLSDFGWGFYRQGPLRELASPRGHLRVPTQEAEIYDRVLGELEDKGSHGPLLAGPDSPEFAFLSGRADAHRSPFAIFDRAGTPDIPELVLQLSPADIVINTQPSFSRPYTEEFFQLLLKRYASWRSIGPFLVGTEPREIEEPGDR